MARIKPSLVSQDIVCAETPAGPNALVVFGASGDLTKRKLLPSLFELYKRELISENFYLLGCGRKELSDEQFRQTAKQAIKEKSKGQAKKFLEKIYYLSGSYDDSKFYEQLKTRIGELNEKHKIDGSMIFYLSVPPFLYGGIVEQLGAAKLTCGNKAKKQVKLIVEKPFGRDLDTAVELNDKISHCFDESQIYRIDHYLGKETIQNIMMFRFANAIFEPVWNREYIDHVQITIAESLGVEHRAGYYDKSGALRDMFQNHALQMLALVAMEPPTSFDANRVRDEKVKLLRAIRLLSTKPWSKNVVRGQYASGTIDGKKVIGYKLEQGVADNSKTETFVAAKLFIDNWRWQGVPFYIRTGKRLAAKDTEIAITFKKIPHSMFIFAGLEDLPPNVLVLQIQPDEGLSLSFQAKRPGSKMCMGTLDMNFHYSDVFGVEMPEAYQRLLLDCMLGDQTLFNRYDSVETAWKLLTPILRAWENDDSDVDEYPAGSQSFPQADNLIESDGRKWRTIGSE